MLRPGDQIEKYEVLDEIGGGGMARVFRARHTLLGSLHALKILSPELVQDEELRARFLAEGQIQAQLQHPNIAAVTDIIAQPGIAGLVVELLDGPSLESVIATRRGPPDPAEVRSTFIPVLRALDHAHVRGVIHRDVKPSNIILARRADGTTAPMLLDFGIAKVTQDLGGTSATKGRTRAGARMGTPQYMSPEQIRSQLDVDHRTDVFSTAATLYEAVCGRPAFDADNDFDVMKKIVDGAFTPVHELSPSVDPVVEAAINRGLAVERDERFQSCGDFATFLSKAAVPPQDRRWSRPAPPRTPGEQEITLTVTQGPAAGLLYRTTAKSIAIGRDPDNDLVLDGDRSVSGRHALISLQDGRYVITDRWSFGGVEVNGTRIDQQRSLADGDLVGLGAVILRVSAPGARVLPESRRPPPRRVTRRSMAVPIAVIFMLIGIAVALLVTRHR